MVRFTCGCRAVQRPPVKACSAAESPCQSRSMCTAWPPVDAATLVQCRPGDAGNAIDLQTMPCQHHVRAYHGQCATSRCLSPCEQGIRVSLLEGHVAMSDTASNDASATAQDDKIASRIPVQLAIQTAAVTVTLSELAGVEAGVVLLAGLVCRYQCDSSCERHGRRRGNWCLQRIRTCIFPLATGGS